MSSTSPGPSRGRLGRNKFALGLNLTTAENALSTLSSAELAKVADQARAADTQLAGGSNTVIISTTTLLLILIIVIVSPAGAESLSESAKVRGPRGLGDDVEGGSLEQPADVHGFGAAVGEDAVAGGSSGDDRGDAERRRDTFGE